MAELKTKFYALPLNAYTIKFYDDLGNVTGEHKIAGVTFGHIQDICRSYCRDGRKFKLYIENGVSNRLRYIASNMEGA